jgi:hypothetical protein
MHLGVECGTKGSSLYMYRGIKYHIASETKNLLQHRSLTAVSDQVTLKENQSNGTDSSAEFYEHSFISPI